MDFTTSESTVNIMNLPVEMVEKILSYLSYDQIAKLRAVNRMFNMMCSDKLNKGFILVNQFHNRCLKAVKSKLPRRESERRHHPLARHSDILMAVETRLSMLSMTFSKYVEASHCCFIPGKVLDEALKVLRIVNNCLTPSKSTGQFPLLPRPHDFLQEYRDVSSMAMEHFDDKILPGIRETMRLENPRLYCFKNKSDSSTILVQSRTVEMSRIRGACIKLEPQVSASAGISGVAASNMIARQATGYFTQAKKKLDGPSCVVNPTSMLRVYRALKINKKKYKALHQAMTKLKLENVMLMRQLAQQKVLTKHMRRELRETRAAMNVMSKDLSQIKLYQSCSRGTKRKLESQDEEC